MNFELLHGDCRQVLKTLPDASVDSIVTDPPYELGFMGKGWDRTGVAYDLETWRQALRVLKPGGHLLAFGGTRTFHRMTCAIEDAGFELRDTIGSAHEGETVELRDCPWLLAWIYGSGFPKSKNLSDEWEGWGTALKPAWEPIVMARKPFVGNVAANVDAHGTGALNIDGCRVPVSDEAYARNCSGDRGHDGTRTAEEEGATNLHAGGGSASELGRWPANVVHDGSQEVLAAFPWASGAQAPVTGKEPTGDGFSGNVYGAPGTQGRLPSDQRDGGGSAARFFYCAKATREDRNDGLAGMPTRDLNWSSGTQNPGSFQSPNTNRAAENFHPTVKPTELMRWLCRLVTPPGGTVLDPFTGSGSTGRGAVLEGFGFIGIELEPDYIPIADRRIAAALRAYGMQTRDLFAEAFA